jgi:UDP-N-acetylglucosamine:LPS N-acetylglucosamine transferase
MAKKVVELIYIKAGGGHVATSQAIGSYLKKLESNIIIKYTDIRDILDDIDPIKKYLGFKVENFYNTLISHNFGYGSELMLRWSQKIIQYFYKKIVDELCYHFHDTTPNVIISTIPNFNKAIHQSIFNTVPLIVCMCDFADLPPHFWFENIDAFYICPTTKSVNQAIDLGVKNIIRTNGVVLREEFYNHEYTYIQGNNVVGLVSFGGYGSNSMLRLAKEINHQWKEYEQIDIDFIYLTGHNADLAAKIGKLARSTDKVYSYTSNIISFLEKADFFVGKPGPGSISEALALGVPLVIEKNSGTLVQERYNADWVETHEVGVVTTDISNLDAIMKVVTYGKYTTNAQTKIPKNDALFKVTDLVRNLL